MERIVFHHLGGCSPTNAITLRRCLRNSCTQLKRLIDATISAFLDSVFQPEVPKSDETASKTVRVTIPFKDQKSANAVRRQFKDLSRKIGNAEVLPVFTSTKVEDQIKHRETKPPLVSQQCVVYKFKCDLCDTGYIGYTTRHLFQRIEEHRSSAIGKHVFEAHGIHENFGHLFTVLKKCTGKLDCLIYEMLFIQEQKPKLNTQTDSVRAKVFV